MLNSKIRMYYFLKKAAPRWLQIALRSTIVTHRRAKLGDFWFVSDPVDNLPAGWTGWPNGKKFAIVLTHDVESAKGCHRCLRVADIEERFGFRSSFNFVGDDYEVSPKIREELTSRGFEIGVHGLHHNGSLYHSRAEFLRQSVHINRILREWNAVGFRSPCMYHDLEWLQYLDIEYDCSTFDIDPFEPQPDGMGTIFPFNVYNSDGRRTYVELPYTLPQDFTLFVLMRNRDIDIWKRKLEWVVGHGGMALVITHPDYMSFEGRSGVDEYPSSLYEEFLEYVQKEYKDMYWSTLPRDIAYFWSKLPDTDTIMDNRVRLSDDRKRRSITEEPCLPEVARIEPGDLGETNALGHGKSRHVCMLAYAFYERDNRVRRYAEALAERGDVVDAIALNDGGLPAYEIMNGVNVYRIQERTRNEKTKHAYLFRLLRFLVNSALFISRKHLASKYDLVHVHSVPDFEVLAALLPKLTGAKIILDIHDLVPEFYAAKFSTKMSSLVCKVLVSLEKASIRFSDHVIVSNHLWEKKLINRSAPERKCCTFLNYPDTSIFRRMSGPMNGERFVMIYPGSLNWHQGLDIAIKAFGLALREVPDAEFHIFGAGPELSSLRALVSALGLEGKVLFKGGVSLDSISEVMASASLGVVPKRNDAFGGEAFSTKILEFMALGVPVVISGTSIDRFYFDDSVVHFFEPDNYFDLAKSIVFLAGNPGARQQLASNALAFVDSLTWDKNKCYYFSLVDKLVDQK